MGDIEAEHLKMISGFQDLGSFALPQGSTTGNHGTIIEDDLQRVHAHLALRLRNTDTQQQDTASTNPTDSASEHIGSSYSTTLRQDVDASSSGVSLAVHVYKIHLFSNSAKGLSEITIRGSTLLLFKWAKPQSVYGNLQGSWQSLLLDVISDGVWQAGSELMILVRGVPDQEMREVQALWQEGTSVLEV